MKRVQDICIQYTVETMFPNYGFENIEITLACENGAWSLDHSSPLGCEIQTAPAEWISEMKIQQVVEKFLKAQVPVVPPFVDGVDGVFYHLEISSGMNSVKYTWWCDLPEGYGPMGDLVDQLYKWCGFPREVEWDK